MTIGKNVTVGMLKSVLHCTVSVEYADFETCEEVYNPDDNRRVISVCVKRDCPEGLFVWIA